MHVTTIAVAMVTETRPAACLVVGGVFFSCYNIMVSILLIPFVSNNAIVTLVCLVRGSHLVSAAAGTETTSWLARLLKIPEL